MHPEKLAAFDGLASSSHSSLVPNNVFYLGLLLLYDGIDDTIRKGIQEARIYPSSSS